MMNYERLLIRKCETCKNPSLSKNKTIITKINYIYFDRTQTWK